MPVFAQDAGDASVKSEGVENTSAADSAQVAKPGTETVNKDEKEESSDRKAETEKTAEKSENTAVKKDTERESRKVVEKTETVKTESDSRPSGRVNGLLQITEGRFKYTRIPDIELPEEDTPEYNEEDQVSQEEVIISTEIEIPEKGDDKDKNKGIFGIDKKTGDTIIIVILLLIIIAIIILLKVKSKDRGDSVLRRFPRA